MSNNYGDISQRIGLHAEKEYLKHAEPVLVITKFGLTKQMPKNKGDKVKFRRPIPFAPATTPLTEGVTPASSDFRYEDVEAVLDQYGDWVQITDKVDDLHEDPVGKDIAMMQGEQYGETLEMLTYGEVIGGTSVLYANGASRAAVNTPVNIAMQRRAVRYLKNMKGKKITKILDSSPKFGTQAVEAAFVALCSTDCEADIRSMPNFVPVSKYGNRKVLCPEELGSVDDVRYVCSPEFKAWEDVGGALNGMISTGGTNANVYPVLYLARDAFGVVAPKGQGAINPIVRKTGQAAKGDELGQTGSVGWKTWFTAQILNDNWMIRGEVAATE